MNASEDFEEYKRKKKEAKQRFTAMQNLPYEVKVRRAELRAHEFVAEMDKRGCNAHVSVGGLDSITLLLFLRHIGIDIPAISVSAVEDKSIQQIKTRRCAMRSSRVSTGSRGILPKTAG